MPTRGSAARRAPSRRAPRATWESHSRRGGKAWPPPGERQATASRSQVLSANLRALVGGAAQARTALAERRAIAAVGLSARATGGRGRWWRRVAVAFGNLVVGEAVLLEALLERGQPRRARRVLHVDAVTVGGAQVRQTQRASVQSADLALAWRDQRQGRRRIFAIVLTRFGAGFRASFEPLAELAALPCQVFTGAGRRGRRASTATAAGRRVRSRRRRVFIERRLIAVRRSPRRVVRGRT